MLIQFLLWNLVFADEITENLARFNFQNFRPTIDSHRFLVVNDSALGIPKKIEARATFTHTSEPLVFEAPTLSSLSQLDLALGYTIGKLRLAATAPLYLQASGSMISSSSPMMGQVIASTKYQVQSSVSDGLGLAFQGSASIPLENQNDLNSNLQLFDGEIIFDTLVQDIEFIFNLGYRYQQGILENKPTDYHLFTRLGVAKKLGIDEDIGVSIEYLNASFDQEQNGFLIQELIGGGWFSYMGNQIHLGLSTGLHKGVMDPNWRFVVSVRHEGLDPTDTDGDGITDIFDICPATKEDIDQYEDSDGCPEVNILTRELVKHEADEVDKAFWNMKATASGGLSSLRTEVGKFDLELSDDFQEQLVVAENMDMEDVGLGSLQLIVLDEEEQKIPHAVWQIDGKDTVPHRSVGIVVPMLTGQHQLVIKAKGYREYRHDVTIVSDTVQVVHLTLEQSKVDKNLQIQEKIYFKMGSHEIDERSHQLLNEVAEVLLHHSLIEEVRIEGYTDSLGNPETNKQLSQARANEVRNYLIQKGVEPERLVAKGYGQENPIASNDTEEGRATNRRVVFVISKRHGE